jgi:hypothetical protein
VTVVVETCSSRFISFTGNVPVDFSEGPDVIVASDATQDVFFTHGTVASDPYSPVVNDPSGWNIYDVRFSYDALTDTGFIGMCVYCCCAVVFSRR